MAIEYAIDSQGETLLVETWGRDESIEEVMEYGQAVIQAGIEKGCTKVLCDERNLEYALETIDTYEYAKFVAEMAPKVGKVAIVFNPQCSEEAKFWETVAVNRGVQVAMFRDMEQARRWLNE